MVRVGAQATKEAIKWARLSAAFDVAGQLYKGEAHPAQAFIAALAGAAAGSFASKTWQVNTPLSSLANATNSLAHNTLFMWASEQRCRKRPFYADARTHRSEMPETRGPPCRITGKGPVGSEGAGRQGNGGRISGACRKPHRSAGYGCCAGLDCFGKRKPRPGPLSAGRFHACRGQHKQRRECRKPAQRREYEWFRSGRGWSICPSIRNYFRSDLRKHF